MLWNKVYTTLYLINIRPFKRNSKTDWERVRNLAREGNIESTDIPADVYVRHYNTLRNIAKDNARPNIRDNPTVHVFHGVTGSGKSHRAFTEATTTDSPFYRKNPSTKWWDGYKGERKVVIDEFSGLINVTHLLQWFDKWPCNVEIKGSQLPLRASEFWVTSNKSPEEWYRLDPSTNTEQINALRRRLTEVVHFGHPYGVSPLNTNPNPDPKGKGKLTLSQEMAEEDSNPNYVYYDDLLNLLNKQ